MNKSEAVKEFTFFEFYAKNIWSFHRIFVKKYLTPRCKKCCISAKASPLNSDGICKLCLAPRNISIYTVSPEKEKQMENDLDVLLHSYEGRGKGDYDAVVMVSGGKDSTLLIHRLLNSYPKLRLLALTIDNTFMSPVALDNVTLVVKSLKVAHIILRPNPQIFKQAFSYAFTHMGELGCAQTVDTVDGELFTDAAKNITANLKIPLLLIGFSFEQVDRYLHWDSYENEAHQHKKREKVGIYNPQDLLSEEYRSLWWDPSKFPKEDIPRVVCPFYVWRMNEIEVKKQTVKLGILNEKETSPLVTNNALIPLCGLVDVAHLGYSSWEPEFSRMVREGKTDKELWQSIFELLEYSAKTGKFISKSVDDVLARLDLTREVLGIQKK